MLQRLFTALTLLSVYGASLAAPATAKGEAGTLVVRLVDTAGRPVTVRESCIGFLMLHGAKNRVGVGDPGAGGFDSHAPSPSICA